MPVHQVLQFVRQKRIVMSPGRTENLAVEKDCFAAVASCRHGGRELVAAAEVAARAVEVTVKNADPRVGVHPRRPLAAEARMHGGINDGLEVRPDPRECPVCDGYAFLDEEIGVVRYLA